VGAEMKNFNIPLSSPDITELEKKSVLQVLETPNLSQGMKIKEFEKKIADFSGFKYCVAVNSGTSALHLIVKSLGLKEGDEVITTPFSFIASSNCLLMERVKPVFVDVQNNTYNIDPDLIEEKITDKTKAILVVHIFGQPAEMKKIYRIAKKYKLKVIEDACEAIGSEYSGDKIGTKSDATTFAFYPNKQMTTGEGGVVVTNNKEIFKLCKSMRNQGRNIKGEWLIYERLGYNYRLDEMSAALGVAQIDRINEILSKRQSIAEEYVRKLKTISGLSFQYIPKNIKMSWFTFVIRVNKNIRQEVVDFLQDNGISCRKYFPCIHLEPFYKKRFGYKEGDFPIAEEISKQTIALPFYNNLNHGDIDYIVNKLKSIIK
jgi:perosamine synthetase